MNNETRNHLRGIIAIWMTNGNKPVDGGNDTRYEFFSGGWDEAARATVELIELGYAEHKSLDNDFAVVPTSRGIMAAFG